MLLKIKIKQLSIQTDTKCISISRFINHTFRRSKHLKSRLHMLCIIYCNVVIEFYILLLLISQLSIHTKHRSSSSSSIPNSQSNSLSVALANNNLWSNPTVQNRMDLEVVGRHALLFDDDATAAFINTSDALVEWHSLSIDRYDVRHLLSNPPPPRKLRRHHHSDESSELDRERYLDLPSPSDDDQEQGKQNITWIHRIFASFFFLIYFFENGNEICCIVWN